MRRLSFLLFFIVSSLAFGADYKLIPGSSDARVEVNVSKPAKVFRMPAWLPGDYQLFNYGRVVSDLVFKNGDIVVEGTPIDVNAWSIAEGATSANYAVKPSSGNFSPNLRVIDQDVFVNGGGVFGAFEGTEQEKVRLTLPEGAVCSLKREGDVWEADDYDHLLDSPIAIGPSVRIVEKQFHGKNHRIVAFGKTQNADLDGLLDVLLKVADQSFKLFGELPYERYSFFLDFGGFPAGLEHRDSARIGVGIRSAPVNEVGIMFHEYFHCFNVKRIRAEALGPFDYSKPAVTGTLWWLEGVTDYYAAKLAERAGYGTREGFLASMGGTALGVAGGNYLKHSADEASKRVWEVRGSAGFEGVNYYSKGRAIGLLLDLAILGQTGGKKSLDDVMRQLYKECRLPKPGYKDARLREICVQIGGEKLGPWYDKVVMTADPMPWDEVLPTVGLKLDGRALVPDESGKGALTNWP